MPAIGPLSFTFDDGFDCGLALNLAKKPDSDISFPFGNSLLMAFPASPYVVCRFSGATTAAETYKTGTLLTQQSLDMMAITGVADLMTHDAENEYIIWWKANGRRVVLLASTLQFGVKAGPAKITVTDAQGNVIPQPTVTPAYHTAFRFYRLSQCSDDLYDAYRNMYLAFESLLSSQFPKVQAREKDWFLQSLTSASTALSLASLVPPGTTDPVAYIFDTVYQDNRNLVFHAKGGKPYFVPLSAADRKVVVQALTLLRRIVLEMANKWFSARRISSWINVEYLLQQSAQLFQNLHFVFLDDPSIKPNENPSGEAIAKGAHFTAHYSDRWEGEVRHNVSATVSAFDLNGGGSLQAIYLVREGAPYAFYTPEAPINTHGFDECRILFTLRGRNLGMPKEEYPR